MTITLQWLQSTHFRFPISGSATSRVTTRQVNLMNRVLCRIEAYANNIDAITDATAKSRAQRQLSELMRYQGARFNQGHNNMEEALQQIQSTGSYSDSGTTTYTGGMQTIFPLSVDASDPFVWFAQALDERLIDARARLLDYQSSFEELAERVAIHDSDTDSWQRVRTAFDAVTAARTQVERYHWMLAIPVQHFAGYARSQQLGSQINSIIDNPTVRRSLRAYDLVSTLDEAGRMSQQIQAASGANLSNASADVVREFSDLLAVLRVTCHFLPVLSNFYEAMFDGIPTLVSNFRTSLEKTPRHLESALRHERMVQRGIQSRGQADITRLAHVTPPVIDRTRCSLCGCNVQRPCS